MPKKKLEIEDLKHLVTFKTLTHPKGIKELGRQFKSLNDEIDDFMQRKMMKTTAGINIKDIVLTADY